MPAFIPVNQPLLDGNEKKYLAECIDTNWISSDGPFVRNLEEGFASRVGRKHGITVSNGSVALELAVAALGLEPDDEVILPTFTIISCAAAIVRAGAIPVVVDSDPLDWNMDVSQVARLITDRTRAVMVVHIYGLPTDMQPVIDLSHRYNLKIIEDAAEAHGQTYNGKPCGSYGDISIFSFYPNKLTTTGEGGMILTDDPAIADKCRSFRNLCFGGRRFVHEHLGWNARMSNIQAAVGLAQLERLDEFVRRKREIGRRYSELLGGIPGLQLPLASTPYAENIYWIYGLVLDDCVPFDASEAMKVLRRAGIGTRPFFWPMHEQPVFRKKGLFNGVSCPVAERLGRRGFYIPSGLALREDQAERVAEAIWDLIAPCKPQQFAKLS